MPVKNHGPKKTLENFIAAHHNKMMNCTKSSAFQTEFRTLSIPTLSKQKPAWTRPTNAAAQCGKDNL